ncbi:ATP-dependent DNA helicase [Trichonephila clavipes]|nr:ATP-dependent DNA helicase [Trichonephila clavipes]
MQDKNISKDWVPIGRRNASIYLNNNRTVIAKRNHFPLTPACVMTLHKSQGGTFDETVYSYEKSHQQQLVHVALSRVTSLECLFIVSPTQDHVFYHGQKNSATTAPLTTALERLTLNPLRPYQQLLLDFMQDKLAILTINCQSLRAHQTDFDDIISQNCTLLMLAESWLGNDESLSILNFDCCVQFKRPGHRTALVL